MQFTAEISSVENFTASNISDLRFGRNLNLYLTPKDWRQYRCAYRAVDSDFGSLVAYLRQLEHYRLLPSLLQSLQKCSLTHCLTYLLTVKRDNKQALP